MELPYDREEWDVRGGITTDATNVQNSMLEFACGLGK